VPKQDDVARMCRLEYRLDAIQSGTPLVSGSSSSNRRVTFREDNDVAVTEKNRLVSEGYETKLNKLEHERNELERERNQLKQERIKLNQELNMVSAGCCINVL